jgi:hypothetical protein
MHPLLIHSASVCKRVSFAHDLQNGRWTARRHGIRVAFNLSTGWRSPPFSHDDDCGPAASPSLLERSTIAMTRSSVELEVSQIVRYGEPVFLRFRGCGCDLIIDSHDGGARVCSEDEADDTRQLVLFEPHASAAEPRARVGDPVRFADLVALRCCRTGANEGVHLHVRPAAADGCPAYAEAMWDDSAGDWQAMRVESYINVAGVPLRAVDTFYLKSEVQEGHLTADVEGDEARVYAVGIERGEAQALEVVRL